MIEPAPFLSILSETIDATDGLDDAAKEGIYSSLELEIRRRCSNNEIPTREDIRRLVSNEIALTPIPDISSVPSANDFFPSSPSPFAHEILHTRRFIKEVLIPLNTYYELPVVAGRGPRNFNISIPVYEIGINDIDSMKIVDTIRRRQALPGIPVGIYGLSRMGMVFISLPFSLAGVEMSYVLLESGVESTNDFRVNLE